MELDHTFDSKAALKLNESVTLQQRRNKQFAMEDDHKDPDITESPDGNKEPRSPGNRNATLVDVNQKETEI